MNIFSFKLSDNVFCVPQGVRLIFMGFYLEAFQWGRKKRFFTFISQERELKAETNRQMIKINAFGKISKNQTS